MIKTIFFLPILLLFFSSLAIAQSTQATPLISISDAIGIAKNETPGRVLRAEWRGGFYKIRIKTDSGKDKTVLIDAENGDIVERNIISIDDSIRIATKEVPGKVEIVCSSFKC